ncbi:MAG TPA: peptidoglycan-binding domain-containing protein [Candidatus Paceibacterota bacterium]|nr:peptidoglycan-binding domain-containing protein [Candidatus Paceibacterota bacterium]
MQILLKLRKSHVKALSAALISAVLAQPFMVLMPTQAYADSASAGQVYTFSNPGTTSWNIPVNATQIRIKAWGGGGGGGNGAKTGNHNISGFGGGAGAYASADYSVSAPNDSLTITVGAGGTAYQTGSIALGGSNSEIRTSGGTIIAGAGGGGAGVSGVDGGTQGSGSDGQSGQGTGGGLPGTTNNGAGGHGGTAYAGDVFLNGGDGGPYAFDGDNPYASDGGSSPFGGAGGSRGRCGRDGACPGSQPGSSLAQDGAFPGGGGGGSDVGTGGYGANGQVTIEILSTSGPADQAPIGFLDSVSCSSINGWTLDPDTPAISNTYHIYMDGPAGSGTVIAGPTASDPRGDVNNATGYAGDHGFSYPTPDVLKDGGTHQIYVYGINTDTIDLNHTNTLLNNSPMTLSGCTLPSNPGGGNTNNGLSVSISATPSSVTIPNGGSAPVSITSTAAYTSNTITHHGLEVRFNGGAWQNAGAWPIPVANSAQVSDASFTTLDLTQAGSYDFRAYASADGGANYVYSSIQTVSATTGNGGGGNNSQGVSVDLSVASSTVSIPNGGSVQLSMVSAATVTGGTALTQHGLEMRLNGGAWMNAGAWNGLVANAPQATDASFSALNINQPGAYEFRAYASIDGTNYVYSSIQPVLAAGGPGPGTPLSVSVSVNPSSVSIPNGGSVAVSVTSTASYGGSSITHHGLEISYNGGAWMNAGAWPNPVPNVARTSDASFVALNLSQVGTYDIRAYTSTDGGVTYVYSAPQTVTATVGGGGGNNGTTTLSVTMTATPTAVIIPPSGGGATISITSTANVPSGATLTQHGLEMSVNGGAWQNAGAWNNPLPNTARITDATFPMLTLTIPAVYTFRAYASTDNGATYVYSPVQTVSAEPLSVDISVNPTSITFTSAGQIIPVSITSTATYTGTNGALSHHGLEMRLNGGAWQNAGAWNPALPNVQRSTDASFTALDLTQAGSYDFRAYASADNGATYVYSPTQTVTATSTVNNGGNNGGGNTGGGGGSSGGGSVGTGGGTGPNGACIGNCPPTSNVRMVSSGGGVIPGDIWILIDSVKAAPASGPTAPELVCPSVNLITKFLKAGTQNDPNEVRKLQYFLNTYENAGLNVDGVFDAATEAAVKAFQNKYADEVLAPWGANTAATGIVYITTARKINLVFCADHPNYDGSDVKDIIDNNVLNNPTPDNSGEFQGVIGQATTSPNIAGVFGAFTGRLMDILRSLHLYPLLVLLLLLLGMAFILQGTFIKDINSLKALAAFMRGIAILAVGSVLNVLNTLSFMLNPAWLAQKTGLTLAWVLALDVANALAVVAVCIAILLALYSRIVELEKNASDIPINK